MNLLTVSLSSWRLPACCAAMLLVGWVAAGQPATTNLPRIAPAEAMALDRIRALLADKSHPLTWVFTGDSITHGAKHTHGSRTYVEHFAERVRWELGRGQDIVINSGISGDKADGILRTFDWRVGRFKPDVVSIMIGMNDCTGGPEKREEFRNNLRELIRRTRGLGAVPVLHTQNIIDPAAAKERGDLPAYATIVAEVTSEQKTVLVDHWEHWRSACKDPQVLKEWLNDPIHPNARGHRELAILTFQVLGIYATNSPTCQSIPPVFQ
jgi:lysophospholipase L1-like esterase